MQTEESKTTPPPADSGDPSTLRMVFTLGFFGFLSGILLVGIFLYTLPFIEANKAEDLRVAIFQVLPGCVSFKTFEVKNGKLVELSEQEKKTSKAPQIFLGFDASNKMIGFAIPSTEPGFQDIISAIFGFDPNKKVIIGFEVLDSKETPGLGDKIIKDVKFKENFKALAIDPEVVPVKNGEKKNPNEVETITGATISSKTVVRLIQKAVTYWKPLILAYIEEQRSNKK